MFIDYKLIGNANVFRLTEIESSISLSLISMKAKELYDSYENTLRKSCILIQALVDIFATDIFSDHDEFFQKIIIYSLTIEKLQQDNEDLEFVVIYDTDCKIENYLNQRYDVHIKKYSNYSSLSNENEKKNYHIRKTISSDVLKIFFGAVTSVLKKRVVLVSSLIKIKNSRSILLHHSGRFDDLISSLNKYNLGQIDTVSYLPIKPALNNFYINIFTILLTLISIILIFALLPIVRYSKYPLLAEQFNKECRVSLRYIQQLESSAFYFVIFYIVFKTKNINEIFVYSHLSPLMRCFLRCARESNKKINYIRYNHLYFTTELCALHCSRFYVRSRQEANIARQISMNNVLVLESETLHPSASSMNNQKILYIDESNLIDAKHPKLRSGIYSDLVRLTRKLDIEVSVRPHPTDKTAHLRLKNVLNIDNDTELQSGSIIIGRNSTLLLKLASLGKTVIVYDPSRSLWFQNQSRLDLHEDIVFLTDYMDLESQIKTLLPIIVI